MVKIFVIILNWNRKKDTLECLESLSKVDRNKFKLSLIVVDNASKDDSRIAIKRYLKKTTFNSKNLNGELIKNRENLGFAAGNNVGMHYALAKGADYILILNNDTLVDENIFNAFLKKAKTNTMVGIFSPKIYFAPGYEYHKNRYKKKDRGRVVWYAGGKIDWDNVYGINFGVDEVDDGQFEKTKELDFATGACMFIRTKALRDIGVFDEKYYMYLEDADLSLRSWKKNWKILFIPKAKVWHKVAQSSGIGSNLNDYFITRNRLLFGFKYASLRTRSALFRESLRFLLHGRKWQKQGVIDYFFKKFGKGSWK